MVDCDGDAQNHLDLKIKFAATIALALSIADMMKNPCSWWVEPAVLALTPPSYAKWVPVVLGWILREDLQKYRHVNRMVHTAYPFVIYLCNPWRSYGHEVSLQVPS